MSIILGLYQEHYLETIERILKSRRIEDIKLTCLDWLSQFHHNISKQRYDEINSLMAAPAKTELLRLQALLNLLYVNRFPTIATSILSLFKTTDNPRLFYRLINNLSENAPLWYTFGASTLREIKFLCNEKNFNVKQKKELEHKFDNLKSYYEN